MNNLVEVKHNQAFVSARTLHKELEIKKRFSGWVEQNFKDFVETEDFTSVLSGTLVNNGALRELEDYHLTLEMAKHLAMMSRTEKGREIRNYFIEVEKEYNSPEKIMARALSIANEELNTIRTALQVKDQQIAELQPKVNYYDIILQNKDVVSISVIAKDFGLSARKLNEILHQQKVQFKQGKTWLLYQKYAEKGYTQTKTQIIDGCDHLKAHTYWTQKGRLFISDLLKSLGYVPNVEKNEEELRKTKKNQEDK